MCVCVCVCVYHVTIVLSYCKGFSRFDLRDHDNH